MYARKGNTSGMYKKNQKERGGKTPTMPSKQKTRLS